VPARVIFRPPPGAGLADPVSSGAFDPRSPGGATGVALGVGVLGSPEGVLLQMGAGTVAVPAGTYQLFVTRGPEYEALEVSVTVAASQVTALTATLDRTVDTRGWLAADMHVHMGPGATHSFDSALPIDRRVISLVSSGIEIIVPTDHNVVTDLSDTIASLGYDGALVGQVPGNEVGFRQGHMGVYGYPYRADAPAGGSLPWACKSASGTFCLDGPALLTAMHALSPDVVATVNHPVWPNGDLGYFTNIGWQPPARLETAGAFEALELLSGYWTRTDVVDQLRADWFALLDGGYRVAALGNSDSHRINWVRAGFPRTWLRLPIDRPGEITPAMLADAIRHQRAVASTGPFVNLTVDGGQIGDMIRPARPGRATVSITVDAPNWMTVDTLRLYTAGGTLAATVALPSGRRPVYQGSVDVPVDGDTWVVAVASGQKALPGDVVGEYSEANGWRMLPYAVTNPVWIDADGDGVWTPRAPSASPSAAAAPAPASLRRPLAVPEECASDLAEPPLAAPGDPAAYLMPLLFH
jgi:hypothetical protein